MASNTYTPFADNMIPITRYVFWLFRRAPAKVYLFMTELLPGYLQASLKVLQKTRGLPNENRQKPTTPFEKEFFDIQKSVRDTMVEGGKGTTLRMILSIILILFSIFAGLTAVRLLAVSNYIWMIFNAGTAIIAYFLSSYLFQSIDRLLARPYLLETATEICHLLNSHAPDTLSSVPYFIFGHDHDPSIEQIRIRQGTPNPNYPQWYINAGSWVPVFSEEDQLIRENEQLTFFRLVTKNLNPHKAPQLWQWIPGGERPLPVRVFE